jgi:recombination associated protein RdgC
MIYRLNKFEETADSLEDKLAKMALQPITGSDMQTRGWVAPKADGEPFVHALGNQMMICLGLERSCCLPL